MENENDLELGAAVVTTGADVIAPASDADATGQAAAHAPTEGETVSAETEEAAENLLTAVKTWNWGRPDGSTESETMPAENEETPEVTAYRSLAWPIRVAEKAARAVVDHYPDLTHPVPFWETENDLARYVTTLKVVGNFIRENPDATMLAVMVQLRLHDLPIDDGGDRGVPLIWQVYADTLQTIDRHAAAVEAERKLATARTDGILRVPITETTLEPVTGPFDPTF